MYSILYVDDEQDLLEIAKLFLESSQEFSVNTEDSAEKGLQLLKQQRFDAIISDFQMPAMNGIDFLKTVRSTLGNIPFIIFTGRGREEVVIEALNYGADFYLQKGGDPNALFYVRGRVGEFGYGCILHNLLDIEQVDGKVLFSEDELHNLNIFLGTFCWCIAYCDLRCWGSPREGFSCLLG